MDVEAWNFPLEIEFKDVSFTNQAEKKLYLLKEKAKKKLKLKKVKLFQKQIIRKTL
jgi:ribosomal protein L31E